MAWLVRGEEVLATVEVPGVRGRMKGLRGRDGIEGGLVLRPCRQVHTLGMCFSVDVAFCGREGEVLRRATLPPWRVSCLVWRARFVVEAQAGAFDRWNLRPGDRLEVRE
jgi:uncharacterized membrane protein (UPF0127 family)